MANNYLGQIGYHAYNDAIAAQALWIRYKQATKFTYRFTNFFHPFVGELIAKLNTDSLSGMLAGQLDPALLQNFFKDFYSPNPTQSKLVQVEYFPKQIDVSEHGPYANYNWELFFHIPLMIAVHLSKTQRFAEAQRWFHYIFDPTSNEQGSVDPAKPFWKFLAFKSDDSKRIEEIVRILSRIRVSDRLAMPWWN